MTFALVPPYVIPPRMPRYPQALVRYILARIPPPATPVPRNKPPTPAASPPGVTPPGQPGKINPSGDGKPPHPEAGFTMPLSMPTMPVMPTMNFSLDMKNVKWGWPGYLTFGKGGSTAKAPSPLPPSPSAIPAGLAAIVDPPKDAEPPEPKEGLGPNPTRKDTLDVDTTSLLEAISTESIGSYTRAASPAPSALSKSSQLESGTQSSLNTGGNASPIDRVASPQEEPERDIHGPIPEIVHPPPPAPSLEIPPRTTRSFLASTVHLTGSEDALTIERKRVLQMTVGIPSHICAVTNAPAAR